MKQSIDRETAERRVVNKYKKLYTPLTELVGALQDLEPGGTLVDDATLVDKVDGETIRIAYVAHPVMLTIQTEKRVFILRMIELGT